MITFLVIVLGSLVITSLIYLLIHLQDVGEYLDSVHWIKASGDWIANLPEFWQIFLSVLVIALFIAYLSYCFRKMFYEW